MTNAPYTYIHHAHPHPVMNLCSAITFICASYMGTALWRPTAAEWKTRLGDIGRKGLVVEVEVRSLINRPFSQTDLAYVRAKVDAFIYDLRTVHVYEYRGEPQRIQDAADAAWNWIAAPQSEAAISTEITAVESASAG